MILNKFLIFFFCLFRAKNMKKKFQFLRRRNTDTAIGGECHSSSVFRRPTPDQVQKWSRSFDSLLNDKGMCPYRSIRIPTWWALWKKWKKSHYFNKYINCAENIIKICSLDFFSGGIELFRGFLRSEFSEENLEFWIACQEYKQCEDSQMLPSQSQKIYGDFVAVQAPKEVWRSLVILQY